MNRRAAVLLVACVSVGAFLPGAKSSLVAHAANYTAPSCVLAAPPPGAASPCSWQGVTLHSPTNAADISPADLTQACSPDTVGNCEDTKITVPQGVSPSTLYLKVAWQHPAWQAYMYVFDPSGALKGTGGLGCDQSSFEKGCGNQTTLPFDELAVMDPAPGVWTVRVAAVNIHQEGYTGQAALVHSNPLQYAAETLDQLTTHLTRTQRVNVVFAGWTPSPTELQQMRDNLTAEFRPSVSEKQIADGGDVNDQPGSGLVQHETSHYTATDSPDDTTNYNKSGNVPYFEPLRFEMDYHFLAADDTWTKDLFAAMKKATTQDHPLNENRVPETTQPAPFEAGYLAKYEATDSALFGGPAPTDPTVVDEIDGPSVEDWIQNTRLDAKYCQSFTDLRTGARTGAAFINPDPNAARDPFWNGNNGTTTPTNLDRDPQGDNTGLTFFLLDTYTPSYASDYFRTDHFHMWWTADHVLDPDSNTPAFQDNGRGWGGRYRFSILDLGAAPSTYERADWVSTTVAADGGSAAFDPPIWDYRHNPHWDGSQPADPLQAGGNTLGAVMGWEITQGLAFKYVGAYLYRPVPNDVYIMATSQLVDHYSLPSEGDFYSVDMNKVDQPALALRQLSSAAPYDTFLPGPSQTRVLGCAANRTPAGNLSTPSGAPGVTFPVSISLVPDPKCNGSSPLETPDGLQQAIEEAKAHGTGELEPLAGQSVFDYAINVNYLRDYVDEHRDQFAPLSNGAFTIPVLNIMFEHEWNVALPLLAGGISSPANAGEGWGQIDNVNDNLVPADAIDCAGSAAAAPGCNGVPDVFRHNYTLTYVMIHESSHFMGLPHPHDGTNSVQKATNGQWQYYYSMLKWLYDVSASPTTYAGDYSVYEDIDQDRLMYGHAAEYLKEAQDWIRDAFFQDGMAGAAAPSPSTVQRLQLMRQDVNLGSALFQRGDYLHSMYAMRNAALHAKGVTGAPVAPHRMSLQQAASDQDAIFAVNPQALYDPNGCAAGTLDSSSLNVPPASTASGAAALPNTAAATLGNADTPALLALGGLLGALLVGVRRRRRGGPPVAP